MAVNLEIGGMSPFDCTGDVTSIGPRWKRWKTAFQFFAEGKGVKDAKQKRSLLLHSAGMDVQEIYATLTDPGPPAGTSDSANVYEKALRTLDAHFAPQVNVPFERHIFRQMYQEESENVDQFVTRLKRQAENCMFEKHREEQIRDQVIDKCRSSKLRRKLLEKGQALTLNKALSMARSSEGADLQARKMESSGGLSVGSGNEVPVNSVSGERRGRCYRCGKDGHFARDKICPALDATCSKCHIKGHYADRCKTKLSKYRVPETESSRKKGIGGGSEAGKDAKRGKRRGRQQRGGKQGENCVEDDDEYAFSVYDECVLSVDSGTVQLKVGGAIIKGVLIDSGASCNVVDKEMWEDLKSQGINCESEKGTQKLFSYGSAEPLSTLGRFRATVQLDDQAVEAEFIVISGKGRPLLGRKTAVQLGVLRLGQQVNSVDTALRVKFKECFEGIGKLKGYQAKIHVDPEVLPVAQNPRRVPFSLREKLELKLKELQEADIIEKVEGPTPWVSPVCVVPKPSGDIRLCVDMRRANEAVLRERHPIPTVDEILQNMNQSTVFSKLDLRWRFHQIELAEDSRGITTFTTHAGLFRYKRLMFGISSAPELYQHIIQQVLQGCEGAHNIADDIVIHGRGVEEHDRRLDGVFQRLKERGLTVNPDKCEFRIPRITFMGHVLSEKGIGPTEEKVKAVSDAREPENASEVRSFLGLVNFCARFIPDLATTADPLRKLTRQNEAFQWGPEQKQAFQQLKEKLSKAETLVYFDKKAKTQVIADASPVGLGAILIQEQDGTKRVVAYASRSLTEVERRYSQTEKEALGLVWACERFHVYLYGIQFELLTDHKPLEVIYSSKSKPSARIERWVLRLQPYHFTVKHLPGSENIADTLSRLTQTEGEVERNVAEEYIRFLAEQASPNAVPIQEVERESAHDVELSQLRECIKSSDWSSCPAAYKYVRYELAVLGKLVLRGTRIVMPQKLREQVLDLAHEGHQGVVKTKQRLRSKAWWPGVDRAVEAKCEVCHGCQLVAQPPPPEPMRRTQFPSEPWCDLAGDLLGPLPSGEYLFVVVDYYSRYFEVAIMKSVTSRRIIDTLETMFSTHGIPNSLKTDNGPQFVSDEIEKYFQDNDIEHRTSTPLWPQANGEVERQNRSLLKVMRIAQAEKKDWRRELLKFLTAYRSTPHTTTGVSPAKLLFGREIRTKLPSLGSRSSRVAADEEVQDKDIVAKQKGKDYADNRRNARESDL